MNFGTEMTVLTTTTGGGGNGNQKDPLTWKVIAIAAVVGVALAGIIIYFLP